MSLGLHDHEITTPRLHMRLLDPSTDASAIHLIRKDPEVMKWTSASRVDADVAESAKWIAERGLRSPGNCFNPAIVLLNDDEISGGTDVDAGLEHGDGKTGKEGVVIGAIGMVRGPELGYYMNAAYHGKGYATEAAMGMIELFWRVVPSRGAAIAVKQKKKEEREARGGQEYQTDVEEDQDPIAFSRGWDYIEGVTDFENVASKKVLRKCGFTLWRHGKDDYQSAWMGRRSSDYYRLPRPGTVLQPYDPVHNPECDFLDHL